ncbi:MAG: proline--tRNA ligase [Chloroflexota bacterium]|nr:proline--tRNA ligase [Chloroflexota bacterium]
MVVSTRMSRYFLKTLREAPAEAELPSHRLLLRAGLVMPLAAGLYCFTPLGWRAMQRVEELVREEMNRAGAQELRLPALQPVELWEQSGRNEIFGDVLYRVSDRRERDFVLAPTHEEAVSALAASQVQSYRDLPVTLYQFQQKFRDEPRPRGGLIRLREFCMKDAYSFDPDWETLDESYQAMFDAYARIFERAEVPAVPVEADSGAIGGKDSQEFIYLNENGEDEVLLCSSCGYAANAEKATFRAEPPVAAEPAPVERVDTPGVGTIASLAAFLGVEGRQTVKAVFYAADGEPVFVAIRGDLEVNETKLRNLLKAVELEPMDDAAVARHGLVAGSASPVGLEGIRVVADTSATEAVNLVGGANEPDAHLLNLNYGRDWTATLVDDIALAEGGHRCLSCEGTLDVRSGMELGHVFKLGSTYAEALDVRYLDDEGERHHAVMGCYGIGVDRLLAAVLEANHDEDGIIWPATLAPFDVHVVVLGGDKPEVKEALGEVEAALEAAGLEALVDDRDESPGAKFKDADLLGMPVRLTVSPRALGQGGIELQARASGEREVVPLGEVVGRIRESGA